MVSTLLLATLALAKRQDPQAAFQTYQLPIGFSASMPAKPEPLKSDKSDNRKAFLSVGDDAVYFVSDSPVDKDEQKALKPDEQIAAYIFSALSEDKNKHLIKYSDALLDGWPGVEFVIDDSGTGDTVFSRCFEMNGHLMEFGAIYASGGQQPAGLVPFLASIHQMGTPKYGPVTSAQFSYMHIEPDGVPVCMEFPADVKDEQVDLSNSDFKMILHRYEYSRDMRTFSFSYLDLPDGAADSITSDAAEDIRSSTLDALLNHFGATKDSSTTEERDGNDWLTARFDIKGVGYGRADVLYLKGRVYTLIAIGPQCWEDSTEYKRFFDSFEVKNSGN